MPSRKQTFAPQVRSFDLARSSINEEARTVEVVFSTETAEVERWFGVEILDHAPKSVRMKRLQNSAPFLLDHDSRNQIGVVESASIDGKEGRATIRFSKSARADEVFQDVLDGIRSKVSVGYRVHQVVLEKSDKRTGKDTYRVTDWEPFEISMVSIPADDSAGVRSEDQTNQSIFGQRAAQLSTQIIMEDNNPTEGRAAEPEGNTPLVPVADNTPAPVASRALEPAPAGPSAAEIEARAKAMAGEEIERRESIRAIGELAGRDASDISKAIKEGISADDFKLRVFDDMAKANPAYSVARGEDNSDKPEIGTRAYLNTKWGESALRALGSRVKGVTLPEYRENDTSSRVYVGGSVVPFHRSLTGVLTLGDVVKSDIGIGAPIIDETIVSTPELMVFPVDTIIGDTISLSVQVGNPSVGFRIANNGTDSKKGVFESRIFQTAILDEFIELDINGVLNAAKDPARLLSSHAASVTKAVMAHMAYQSWYAGTTQAGADDNAAPGLLAQSSTAATHVLDATGTTGKTSVWLLELGQYSLDHVYGNNTTLNFGEDWIETDVTGANGKKLRVLQNWIAGRFAPRLANKNAAIRIKNISAENGKGVTDDLLSAAMVKAEEIGMKPNAIFMTPRSRGQLRDSRTATNETGKPAPTPMEFDDIPIYSTINLSNAETV
jgi:HK97 family phage prohead protease